MEKQKKENKEKEKQTKVLKELSKPFVLLRFRKAINKLCSNCKTKALRNPQAMKEFNKLCKACQKKVKEVINNK